MVQHRVVRGTRKAQIVRETMRSRRNIMNTKSKCQVAPVKLFGMAALFLTFAFSAFAQTPVVYVAFNGNDANACSRSAQCKTITHALTVVSDGGVVKITASGSYDTFTITRAVSVEADPGVEATIAVPSGETGITIDAGSSDTVTLKRLSLWGSAGNGIAVQANSAATVVLQDCDSRNVQYGASLTSTSTAFTVAGGVYEGSDTSLFVRAGSNKVTIDSAKIYGTSSNAAVDAVGNDVTITRSLLSGSGTTGFNPGVWVKGGSTVVLEYDVISGYGPAVQIGAGLSGNGVAFLSNNTITNNLTGVTISVGTGFTRGNNTIAANSTNVKGTLTAFNGN